MAYFVDLSLPNILTIINTTMKMMIGQIIALVIATYFVRPNFHASESVIPAALNSLATMLNAVFVGVPTAPYGTGVLFMINAHIAAQSGGKPKPINSGAARAAGVPNPAAPSMNAPNMKPMIIT